MLHVRTACTACRSTPLPVGCGLSLCFILDAAAAVYAAAYTVPIGSGKPARPCVCNIFCFWEKCWAYGLGSSSLLSPVNCLATLSACGLGQSHQVPIGSGRPATLRVCTIFPFLAETPGRFAAPARRSCCQQVWVTTFSACGLGQIHRIPIGSGTRTPPHFTQHHHTSDGPK